MSVQKKVLGKAIGRDPLDDLPEGAFINFKSIDFGGSDSSAVPGGIDNWEFFKGSLLGVVRKDKDGAVIFGTAAMIAPGLALSATHLFDQELEELSSGKIRTYLVGIRDEGLEMWNIRKLTWDISHDVCILTLAPGSSVPANHTYYRFPLKIAAPPIGEELSLVGFVGEQHLGERLELKENSDKFDVQLLLASGPITDYYPQGRDRALAPYPSFQVDCGSRGGMSGGVALNRHGHLCGVISRGLSTPDQSGPTIVCNAVLGLIHPVSPIWPKGAHGPNNCIIDMPEPVVHVVDRHNYLGLDGTIHNWNFNDPPPS